MPILFSKRALLIKGFTRAFMALAQWALRVQNGCPAVLSNPGFEYSLRELPEIKKPTH